MKKPRSRSRSRLLKAGCVGAGLLSISNPTQVMAGALGVFDYHHDTLETISNPYPDARFGVFVAAGDVDGDGFADIVVGPAEPNATEFAVLLKTKSGHKVTFDDDKSAGVRVATGDLDGDGRADIITTPAAGAASRAVAWKWKVPPDASSPGSFERFDSSDAVFPGVNAGGVSVAIGDFENDGESDIFMAPGKNGGGEVARAKGSFAKQSTYTTTEGDTVTSVRVAMGNVYGDSADELFILWDDEADVRTHGIVTDNKHPEGSYVTVRGWDPPKGVSVALGDVDHDGRADLIEGAAAGYEPYLKIYSLEDDPLNPGMLLAVEKHFRPRLSDDPAWTGGVRVAAGDVNGDGYADVVFAQAVPEPSTIVSLFTGLLTLLFGSRWRRSRKAVPS